MLKHMRFEEDGHTAVLLDTQRDNLIVINGESRRITIYRQVHNPTDPYGGIPIEGIPFGPYGPPIKFLRGGPAQASPTPNKAWVYGIITPNTGLTQQLFICKSGSGTGYEISLHHGASVDWRTDLTFDELDRAYKQTIAARKEAEPMPETPHHLMQVVSLKQLVDHLANLIMTGESDTYASDDTESRPDAESLWMLAERLDIREAVEDEITERTPVSIYSFQLDTGALSLQVDIRAKTETLARGLLSHALNADAFSPWTAESGGLWTDITDVRTGVHTDKITRPFELVDWFAPEDD